MSGTHNLLAPLTLIWRQYGFSDFEMPEVGDLAGLYDAAYGPDAEWNHARPGIQTRGIFHESVPRNEAIDQMEQAWKASHPALPGGCLIQSHMRHLARNGLGLWTLSWYRGLLYPVEFRRP